MRGYFYTHLFEQMHNLNRLCLMCLFVKTTRVSYFTSNRSPLLKVVTVSRKEIKKNLMLNLALWSFMTVSAALIVHAVEVSN